MGQRVIGISRSLIWSKTLMELIFNPCGEFRWSPEGPVSQIHSPHLHVGTPGIFSDLLRSVQTLKREWGAESNGKLSYLFIPGKTAALVTDLQWKICLLQNCSFGSCAWSEGPAFGQNTPNRTLRKKKTMMAKNLICDPDCNCTSLVIEATNLIRNSLKVLIQKLAKHCWHFNLIISRAQQINLANSFMNVEHG